MREWKDLKIWLWENASRINNFPSTLRRDTVIAANMHHKLTKTKQDNVAD